MNRSRNKEVKNTYMGNHTLAPRRTHYCTWSTINTSYITHCPTDTKAQFNWDTTLNSARFLVKPGFLKALSCVLYFSHFPQYGCRSQRHVCGRSVSFSIPLLQLVRQFVKENLGLRKKKREIFQNSPSRRQGRQNNTYAKKLKSRSSLRTTRNSKKEDTRCRIRKKKREKKERERERERE